MPAEGGPGAGQAAEQGGGDGSLEAVLPGAAGADGGDGGAGRPCLVGGVGARGCPPGGRWTWGRSRADQPCPAQRADQGGHVGVGALAFGAVAVAQETSGLAGVVTVEKGAAALRPQERLLRHGPADSLIGGPAEGAGRLPSAVSRTTSRRWARRRWRPGGPHLAGREPGDRHDADPGAIALPVRPGDEADGVTRLNAVVELVQVLCPGWDSNPHYMVFETISSAVGIPGQASPPFNRTLLDDNLQVPGSL
jgi:hypothetical protein